MTTPNLPNDSDNGQGDAGGAPDPFDPSALRLSQDFASSGGVKKVLTTLPCRKPKRQEFVRVHPGEEWRLETALLEDTLNGDIYLVRRDLWGALVGEISPMCLFLAVNPQGDCFLWPTKLPGEGGRSNSWNDSALAAARHAERRWVRVVAKMRAGMYDTLEAEDELSEPTWPELTFLNILKLCFQGRRIDSLDHPVIKELRGRA